MPFTSSGNYWFFFEELNHVQFKDRATVSDVMEVAEFMENKFGKSIAMVRLSDEEEEDNS